MAKFTHPKDAAPGHKWTFRGHPVLNIYADCKTLLIVYDADGHPRAVRTRTNGETILDGNVIDVPREHSFWLNVYGGIGGVYTSTVYETREAADRCAGIDRIACIPITFKEGEGL